MQNFVKTWQKQKQKAKQARNKMAEPKVEQLYALIEKWTRVEIMARFGYLSNPGGIDFARIQVETKDEIRELLYGTDDLVVLGERWGILQDEQAQAKIEAIEALKRKRLKLQEELAAMDEE